jgi:hypothetical protein
MTLPISLLFTLAASLAACFDSTTVALVSIYPVCFIVGFAAGARCRKR